MPAVGLTRPMLVGLAAAVLGGRARCSRFTAASDVGIVAAVLGACAVALVCVLVFTAMLRLLAPSVLSQMWALRRRTPSAEVGSS